MTTCDDARRRIRNGEAQSISPHLDDCPSCAAYAEAFALFEATETDPTLSQEALDATYREVQATLDARVRFWRKLPEQPTTVRTVVILAIASLALLAVRLFTRRVDWAVYPLMRWLLEAGAIALVIAGLVVSELRPLHLPRWAVWRRPIAIVVGAALLIAPLLLPLAHHAHPDSLMGIDNDLAHRAVSCFLWGLAVSVVLGLPLYISGRGGRNPFRLSAGYWLTTGLYAELALHLHCPIVHPVHIALGHSAIGMVLLLFWSATTLSRRWEP